MAVTIPSLTLSTTPDGISPVNAPLWFTFNASFTGGISANDSVVFVDLQIMNQNVEAGAVIDNPGRFKVPPRGNTYVYNPSDILKTYVTFPYDSSNAYMAVNEHSGFGTGGSYPFIAPETEGIVRYKLHYGIQYNPNFSFTFIDGPGGFARFYAISTSVFCSPGDVISISMDSGLYSYFNGTASVVLIGSVLGELIVTTDMVYDPTLPPYVFANGSITSVQHFAGTSSYFYATNGTKQWFEKDIDYELRYLQSGTNSRPFLTDYGYDSDHAIPIKTGQGERLRFLADIYGDSGLTSSILYGYYLYRETFDSNMVLVGTSSTAFNLTDPTTLTWYSHKCFTVCAFDNVGTVPIVDGYKYKISLKAISLPDGLLNTTAVMWYIGDTKCSKYGNYRIKFLNKQGSWSYWNFNKDTTQVSNIERTEYKRPTPYDFTLSSNAAAYSTSKLRGQAILSSKVVQTFTMNSDWITEDAYQFLAQLIESPEVYIYFDNADATVIAAQLGTGGYSLKNGSAGTNIPIIITDNNYTFKTRNRDKLFNLTISFKYAFDTNLQNQ